MEREGSKRDHWVHPIFSFSPTAMIACSSGELNGFTTLVFLTFLFVWKGQESEKMADRGREHGQWVSGGNILVAGYNAAF